MPDFWQQKVKVAYKPQQTNSSLFPRPKELDDSDRQRSDIVYKINCIQCNFVYYGETERSLKTRVADQKKAVASFDQNSKVASHVHQFSHNRTLQTSRLLVSNQPTASDFSLKPGTLLWTRTLGMITSYFRKPTKASREHELHGHARKLRVTLL